MCGELAPKRCPRCAAPYCRRECQQADWKEHKKVHKQAETALMVPVTEEMRRNAEEAIATERKYGITMMKAVEAGDLDMCMALIDCGAAPDGVGARVGTRGGSSCVLRWPPLLLACQYGYEHIALLLINEGGDINFADEIEGQTPLFSACMARMVDTVKLLLDKGA